MHAYPTLGGAVGELVVVVGDFEAFGQGLDLHVLHDGCLDTGLLGGSRLGS